MTSCTDNTSLQCRGVSEFYAGKTVFVTGASGFLGKVLLEKILWSCPDVRRLYLMLRPKRGRSVEERLDGLLSGKLFDRLRRDRPDFREKVALVSGDLMEAELGLSEETRQELQESVDIVVHSAATVRFDEQLKLAIQMNLEGPKRVAELCEKMKKLQALLHVSTAYCNCDKKRVEETVYAPKVLPQKLLDAVEWMDDDVLDKVTKKLLGPMPNTYTFTKQLAEFYLVNAFPHLPLIILRPSIVGAALQEPVPGWVDSFNGPSGLLAAMGKGLLRCMIGNRDYKANIIPVDVVANMILTSIWYEGTFGSQGQPIYNAVIGVQSELYWGDLEKIGVKSFQEHPVSDVVRPPKVHFTTSSMWYHLNWMFNHMFPAYLLDLWLRFSGKRAVFVDVSTKIRKSVDSLYYFTSQEWEFTDSNIRNAVSKMSASDRKEFFCDTSAIHWKTYLENYCNGVKRYALKEDLANLKRSRAHLTKLRRMNYLWNTVICVILWRLFLKRVPVARQMWVFMLNLAVSLFQKLPGLARA